LNSWSAKQTTINARLSVLSTLKTKLQALSDAAKDLAAPGSLSGLSIFTVSSSNASIVTGTANADADVATHTLLVTQLAKRDVIHTDRLVSDVTTVSDGEGAGTKTIRVSVNGISTDVNIALQAGDTNKSVLSKIAAALNSSSSSVSASVIADTATTQKLVIASKTSGSTNAVSLADVTGTLLTSLGLSSDVISTRRASTSTAAGYGQSDSTKLNAMFTLDDVEIIRGSNTVADVLKGVTLNLTSVQSAADQPVSLSVGGDNTAIKKKITDFISTYNDTLGFLNSKMSIDKQTHARQILAGDTMFNSLRYDLRKAVGSFVKDLGISAPAMLRDVGITASADGTLTLSDSTKLDSALVGGPARLAALFNATNGIALQLKTKLSGFVKTSGVMDRETDSLNSQNTGLTNRIATFNKQLTKKADKYRWDLENLIASATAMQEQQATLASLIG
jgi:flagellar hook-associated protein 2